ncbi:hypothetical protein ONS96_014195 [Cadophora gregata f. sp. sojae]|nr:hypothetical protein ONS96_014195 [Cadophora gregata f. sp. sojae]
MPPAQTKFTMLATPPMATEDCSLIPSDIVEAFVQFIGDDILSHPIDTEPATLHTLKNTARAVGVACMRALKYADDPAMSLDITVTDRQWRDVKLLMVTLCRLARARSATVEMIKDYQIIGILAMFGSPFNNLPFPIPDVAKRLKEIFMLILDGKLAVKVDTESLTIGVTVKSEIDTLFVKKEDPDKENTKFDMPLFVEQGEQDDENTKSESDSENDILTSTYAEKGVELTIIDHHEVVNSERREIPWRSAPPNHPIFGLHGIMHHIVFRKDTNKSYKIDPEYSSRDGSVIGHNGFEVGAWFPRQLAMVRDGMHNHTTAGISGTLAAGAYSVVLSNATSKFSNKSSDVSSNSHDFRYPATNIDLGTVIYYSSTVKPLKSNPSSTSASNINRNIGSLTLAKSMKTGNPIRVIRKWTCDFEDRPSVGFR